MKTRLTLAALACVGALFVAAPVSAAPVGNGAAQAQKSAKLDNGVTDVRRWRRGYRYGYYRRGWPRYRSYPYYAYGYNPYYYPYYRRRPGIGLYFRF